MPALKGKNKNITASYFQMKKDDTRVRNIIVFKSQPDTQAAWFEPFQLN